jgi:exosortase/archaeosortase family protein
MEGDGSSLMSAREVAFYIIGYAAISWGFTYVPSGWLERLTAVACSRTLSLLGFLSEWGVSGGAAYLTLVGEAGPVTVTIIRECTAINVFGVVSSLVIPLRKGSIRRKAHSLVFSGVFLFALNVSRIMLTVLLTGFNVPPFSWFLTNPTVETYHYPISFLYGVIGVALLVLMINQWILPELGDVLLDLSTTAGETLKSLVK